MSQASYNLVTLVPMFQLVYVHEPLVCFFTVIIYKVYHDGAAMTSSVIDAMLILKSMLKYCQIADTAPLTSNAIERERLRLSIG